MALLGGIGEQTVAEGQKDVQADLTQVIQALQPILKLAGTIQTILDSGEVVISIKKGLHA